MLDPSFLKLKIEKISNQALGVAKDTEGKKYFIAKTAPNDEIEGEVIRRNSKFTLVRIKKLIKKSQFRRDPECRFFNNCGGCSLQHLEEGFYREFKIKIIADLLKKNGISYKNTINFIKIGKNSRRKVRLHLDNANNIGFFEQNSNNLVKIDHCLMLEKKISDFYLKLHEFLNNFEKNLIKSIEICSFDNILDVIFEFRINKISLRSQEKLILFAKNCQINLNLIINKEITPLIQIKKPELQIENLSIIVPNSIFLQATRGGLRAINNEILNFITKVKAQNIADIYAGIGSYSFGMVERVKKIDAFEGVEKMTNSINNNAKKHLLSHKLRAFRRDLQKDPVLTSELRKYDAIIINPPRNGAESQIQEISQLSKANIIIVSCDFNSFFRDLKILIAKGFKLQKLTLIDQFYYTSHIEIVAILEL
jgi:23S rRNA (uracil1939-C5)-methyltransferase